MYGIEIAATRGIVTLGFEVVSINKFNVSFALNSTGDDYKRSIVFSSGRCYLCYLLCVVFSAAGWSLNITRQYQTILCFVSTLSGYYVHTKKCLLIISTVIFPLLSFAFLFVD